MLTRKYLLKAMQFDQSYAVSPALHEARVFLEYTERRFTAMREDPCPRHAFARAACPGCAADAAMVASVEVHR